MTASTRNLLTRFASLLVAVGFAAMTAACATAQSQERGWSRAELDQLLAPVALYPDPLLAQLMIAATYPDEIVEAARWSRMHPGLDGEDAVRAADVFDWDPSVKSLLAFPDLLQRMDDKIDWTRELGDAFLAQEDDVMEAVQGLRRRARIEGTLASDDHLRVVDDGPRIQIVFASPAYVYVPYYDTRLVYGRWWWSAHPPVVWAPWPGYRHVPHHQGILIGLWWNTGVRISYGFFYGGIDWPRREVRVVRVDTWYVHRAIERHAPQRVVVIRPGRWQHEPTRRHASLHQRPHAPQIAGRPAPQHDVHRPEVRQPEARRPEARPDQREQARPAPRDTREQPRTTNQPAPRDEARRPEVQQPESRRTDAPERPAATTQAGPQREAHRPEMQRPQKTAVERDGREQARAIPQREAQRPEPRREAQRPEQRREAQRPEQRREAQRPEPRREAQRPEPTREVQRSEPKREAKRVEPRPEARQTESRPQAQAQPAERPGPRSTPERGQRNAVDGRERQPQS